MMCPIRRKARGGDSRQVQSAWHFYIAGNLVGTKEAKRNLITQEGCRKLVERGHELGCHTYNHLKVPYVGARNIVADLERNTAYLDAFEPDRVEPRNFAYPYCASSMMSRRLLRIVSQHVAVAATALIAA